MKCNVCGNVVNEGAKECAVCGAEISQVDSDGKVKKEKFFTDRTQILFVGLIALFLLFYYILNNLIQYGRMIRAFDDSFKALGIGGLIFGIPMILGVFGLVAIQFLYMFNNKISGFDKLARNLPFIGFLIHASIMFLAFVFSIWRAALNAGANDFLTNHFTPMGYKQSMDGYS